MPTDVYIDNWSCIEHPVDVTQGLALGLWQDEQAEQDGDHGHAGEKVKCPGQSEGVYQDWEHRHHEKLLNE